MPPDPGRHHDRGMRLLLSWLGLILAAEGAEPLLKNGNFDAKDLAPWECEEGQLDRDGDNPVLAVTLDGGVFGLSQDFQWPAEIRKSTLTFRVKADQASKKSPVQLRVRLFDKEGNSAIILTKPVQEPGKWIEVKGAVERPDFEPVNFMIESNRGEGRLWLDDVALQ